MPNDVFTEDSMPGQRGTAAGVRRIVKRERYPAKDTTPTVLALAFEEGVPQSSYMVTVAQWSDAAHSHLKSLRDELRSQRLHADLPIVGLRGRLELADQANLRLDRSVGLAGKTVLWTQSDPAQMGQVMNAAVLGWLVDDVAVLAHTETIERTITQLKQLARQQKAIEIVCRDARPFTWDASLGHTAKAVTPTAYPDLADFVARQLEGQVIFPDLPGLRRIASGRLEQNVAELVTEPIVSGRSRFSLVVRVRVLSYPGRTTPVIAIDFTRRVWTLAMKATASVRNVTAYAMPDDTTRAFQFTLTRVRGADGVWGYQPDDDFAPIARRYFLGDAPSTETILKHGHTLPGCKLLVGLKYGVAERTAAKSGVPDRDKIDAFDRITEVLAAVGLTPWNSVRLLESATRQVADHEQHWANRESEDTRKRKQYDRWLAEAQEAIRACYAGAHHLVIAVQPKSDVEADAVLAEAWLNEILQGSVTTVRIRMSHHVHGPRQALPGRELKNPVERAALRIAEWGDFIETVKRYEISSGYRVDGVLVLAHEWYPGNQHDDSVNKRAGRMALATELGVPVQYLRPRAEFREDRDEMSGTDIKASSEPAVNEIDRDFENRLMIAWLDLAYKSLGRVRPQKLIAEAESLYDIGTYPDRILALGVVRRNMNRFLWNERSFLPFAIELDVESGLCSASFAYEDAATRALTWIDPVPLPAALVTLARLGPVQLTSTSVSEDRKKHQVERSQAFFKARLADFGQRSQRPLVLIDADSSRSVWTWLKDEEIDPRNVRLAGGFHAQATWPQARLVRIRTQNSPKVLWDVTYQGVVEGSDDVVRYRAPGWAEAQLFKLDDTVRTGVYLSFGSAIRKRTRGKSCYREIPGMKQVRSPFGYEAVKMPRHTDAWHTPAGLEIVVVRSNGDTQDQVARLVEWLRQCYAHFGEWTAKPAPLFFESVLKQYLADYELEDDDDDAGGDP